MALTEEKYQQKQDLFVERTAKALQCSHSDAEALLRISRQQSVRFNTLKGSIEELAAEARSLGATTQPFAWSNEGAFVVDGLEALRDSTLVHDGTFYIQNAASWIPVIALDPQSGEKILDVCAAPGGKTSHIAQRTNNEALLFANDNSRPRLHKLQANLARLGVNDCTYTLFDATRLTRHYDEASFDKILLDAPCSGEGMMTLDDKRGFESWSPAHIKRLQQLQRKLIVQAWKLLKPGGTLVYSTCTMAPEENEAVVDYLLRHNDNVHVDPLIELREALPNSVQSVARWNDKSFNDATRHTLRLVPSKEVEAFFVAKLHKLPSSSDM